MIIYDLEIKHGVMPTKKSEVVPTLTYCKGWDDYQNMGISVVCAFDYATNRMLAFSDDIVTYLNPDSGEYGSIDGSLEDFKLLVDNTDIVVGFNNDKFDNNVCRASGIDIPDHKSYDLLVHIWNGAGLSSKFNKFTHGGFGLDAVAKANGAQESKSGSGADAPMWYQHKEHGKLVGYCKQDVWVTKMVADKVLTDGFLLHPKTLRRLEILNPYLVVK